MFVQVQAVERKGFKGFCRGGRFWPSAAPKIARVTQALFEVLRKENLIHVERMEESPENSKNYPLLDLPQRKFVDPEAVQMERLERARKENTALKAAQQAEKLEAENAKMRAQMAANKAKAAESPEQKPEQKPEQGPAGPAKPPAGPSKAPAK